MKKEVLKPFLVWANFLILDIKWISLVKVVLKKRGIKFIKNDKHVYIVTRTAICSRMFINYKKLNKVIQKDHFLLSFIDQMLKHLAKYSHLFTFLLLGRILGFFLLGPNPIHPKN